MFGFWAWRKRGATGPGIRRTQRSKGGPAVRHHYPLALAGLVGLALAAGTARAQFQAPPNSLEYEDDATVEVVQGNAIKIRDSKNEDWILQLDNDTKVRLTGEADIRWLQPGVYVRFTADIDKKGTLQKEIKEIEIISAEDRSALGFFTPAEGDEAAKPVRTPTEGTYLVKGKLSKIRDGQMLILAGNRQVAGKLAGECTLKLDIADHTLAQAGDSAKVKAWYFEGRRPVAAFNQPGQALAEEVTITLARPLAYTGKKSRSTVKSTRPASKSSRVSK